MSNGWPAGLYDYRRPERLVVEESTPTADQLDWKARPAQLAADAPDPRTTGPAKPGRMGEFDVVRLSFRDVDGDVVPALLCKPRDREGPVPVVVAVHGAGSNKAQVCAQVAPALTARGFAVLAIDLPHHGERPGEAKSLVDFNNIAKTFYRVRRTVVDVRQSIDLACERHDLDTRHGVVLIGYSLGSWVNACVGSLDDRVKAMVLMVGGAWDTPAPALLVPQIAACDPRLALAHFAGRPLLMQNATQDATVTADMGKRLFAAAPEPKRQIWYECGHRLVPEAYEDCAKWVEETYREVRSGEKNVRAGEPRGPAAKAG